ncbi:flavodoxin family protein [Acetivibrio cellulolyticus]|uniref:flavodoxin family protein n=1 Tax=Acetivibrio cellulolyticus TaxID=35830 RepID=UPI0002481CAC|nr:NAD(P)H-dependent oxidoreductase [Acetivibrio cellulolyticus]
MDGFLGKDFGENNKIVNEEYMRILSIVSSKRKNGNTERLISLLEEELISIAKLQHKVLEIERISLGNVELKMCLGCRVCFDKGEELCPLNDELLSIRKKLNEADGIILASPVYVEDVNGIMKNWIDRMAFNCHRPAFFDKTAIVVATSGIGSTNHALKTMRTALMTWGAYVDGMQKFSTGALMEREEILDTHHNRIKRIAKKFFVNIKKEKVSKPKLYSLIAFKVQQKYFEKRSNEQNTVDYIYWNEKGWLKPCCIYYKEIKTNWLKVKIARLLGNIVAVFFV